MPDIMPLIDAVRFSETNLYKALSNDRFSPSEVRDHPQAKYAYRYLSDPELKSRIILIEHDYTDRDYLDDYANYYAKCYDDIPRRCKRLHFFSINISEADFRRRFRDMIKGKKDTRITNSYLGFVVARPLPVTIIGRSLLKPYPTDTRKGKRRKYCVVNNEKAHVFGVDIPIESLAFQEQDHTLAACATVSLWTCFHKSSSVFHTPMLTPAVITQRANEAFQIDRALPSGGLSVEQIIYAISSNGLVAETIPIRKDTYLRSVLYAYLHYGLPVILGLSSPEWKDDNHAIAISGYSLDILPGVPLINEVPMISASGTNEPTNITRSEKRVAFSSSRIDRFFAHDDQTGPFSKLVIGPLDMSYEEAVSGRKLVKSTPNQPAHTASSNQTNPPPPSPGSPIVQMAPKVIDAPFALWRIPEDRNGLSASPNNQPLLTIPYVVIVPLYHKIRVKILDIQSWLIILSGWLDEEQCLEDTPREFLEWDVYITDLYELKADLAKVLGGNKDLLSKKRIQRHPRFIWRATLKYDSNPLMDLFGDATDIGGAANPFYDVLFYNRALEWKFRRLYNGDEKRSLGRLIDRQIDGLFFKYFAENPF